MTAAASLGNTPFFNSSANPLKYSESMDDPYSKSPIFFTAAAIAEGSAALPVVQ